MRHLVYRVGYSVVPINSSLLTICNIITIPLGYSNSRIPNNSWSIEPRIWSSDRKIGIRFLAEANFLFSQLPARYLSLSYFRRIQYTSSHPVSLRSISILCPSRARTSNRFFPSGLPTTIF